MTRSVFATLAVVIAVNVSLAAAQGSASSTATRRMSANGIVTSVSSASLVMEGNWKGSMTFALDPATRILTRGKITKVQPAIFAPSLKITDVLHRGDLVTVRYYLTGTTLRASEVLVVREARRR